MTDQKIWFITWVSTWFGRCLLDEVLRKGDIVIGTLRKQEQIDEFRNLYPKDAYFYLLDVRDEKWVQEISTEVINKFWKIDILVNNAWYGLTWAIEEASMPEIRDQMETNFFGAIQVTKAFLPMFRQQKFGSIIQISSMAGVVSAPWLGVYNASKYALEWFSEALSIELKPFGVDVMIVEPWPFRTKWASVWLKVAENQINDYDETAGRLKAMKWNEMQPWDPLKGAQLIIKAIEIENPPLRLALGEMAVSGIQRKIDMLQGDLDHWKELSIDTYYS